MRNFSKLNIDLRGHTSGKVKTICPFCHDKRTNKADKSLSVDIDRGLYKCHYCEAQGYVPDEEEERRKELKKLRIERKQKELPQRGKYVRPPFQDSPTIDPAIVSYFESRGLHLSTLQALKVTSQNNAIAFNYFDHNILINVKYRTLNKDFRMIPNAELIPYNVDAILRKPVCYITEGEFDCLTMVQCGFLECISVPNGAQKNLQWMDRFVETHFEDKVRIVLALDNDEKGVLLRNELLRRLGEERCRLVQWSEDCKDANEELMKHGEESVKAKVQAAQEIPLSGIQTAEDVESSLDALFRNGTKKGAELRLKGVDKLLTFEPGRFMVVTGRPGDGKSELVDEICLRLCLLHNWRVAYFSPENTPIIYHLSKLIEKLAGMPFAAGGRMTDALYGACKKWINNNVCHILPGTDVDPTIDVFSADYQSAIEDASDRYTLTAILSKARQAIARRGVRIVVLDPLNNIEPDAHYEGLAWDRKVCFELRRFARKYHCLVILVAHPRKVNRANLTNAKRRVEMNDINGSADYGNMADYCLCVDRDDDLKVVTLYVDKVKFKHLGSRGYTYLHYDLASGRYVPCELERIRRPDADLLEVGKHPTRSGTSVVQSDTGIKYAKTPDWSYFNIRWVDLDGESQLAELLSLREDRQMVLY